MTDKTDVVLLARANGPVERARINGQEVEVVSAGPVMASGSLQVSLTLKNVNLSSEVIGDAPATTGTNG